MTDPYRAGSVWLLDLDFGRGRGEQEKFVVLLSDCIANGGRSVLAIATSQGHHYPAMGASPCEPTSRCYRIDPGQEACFSKTTFIQFDNSHFVTRADLDKAARAGKARFVHTLDEGRFRSILKCAKGSDDLEKWAVALVEQTLKSLTPAKQTPPKGQPAVRPATAPSFVSAEILSVRVRVDKRCATCRSQLAEMMTMTEAAISRVLAGLDAPTGGFLENLGAGLEILGDDCACMKK